MKNLLHEPLRAPEKKVADVIAYPIALVIIIFFYLLKLLAKFLNKFKRIIYKATVMTLVVFVLTNALMPIVNAPKADASAPYTEKFTVDLPMKVNPDMKTREIVLSLVKIEFGEDQVDAFDQIVIHESGWDPKAVNPNGGACGLFQALPCSKMGGTDLEDQIKFGFNYIKSRYGTPKEAWAFWKEHNWY